ncbi:MAG: ribonuclease P protein component [Xanthobacteraceae bacterium]|nr:ribonuclease P protein component [Xanthobacteraceae bacterium]QYK45314.1 MAG: ribonuclease P protein component [Xanthobacteraceae bacterium]
MNRLVKRADFLAAAKGARVNTAPFLLQAKRREDEKTFRVGFTVTKQTGNAVERNRIRRRLRAAARAVLPQGAQTGFDYVLVARRPALTAEYRNLLENLEHSLTKIHKGRR